MSDEQRTEPVEDPVTILDRWHAAGGIWRVTDRRGDTLTISLCQCDGTEADRFTSTSAELEHYLAGRTQSNSRA